MKKQPYYVEATQTLKVYKFVEATSEEEAREKAEETLTWRPASRPVLNITNVK